MRRVHRADVRPRVPANAPVPQAIEPKPSHQRRFPGRTGVVKTLTAVVENFSWRFDRCEVLHTGFSGLHAVRHF